MRPSIFALLLVLLPAAACGGADTGGADPEGQGPEGTAAEVATGAVVATAQADSETILVDGDGMTLYVFDSDTGGESSCYDACAQTWPPLIGEGDPQAQGDADPSLLGTTSRTDGTLQVTYDGRPLYHYGPDGAPGDTNGQGVGGVWWMVAPGGDAITGTRTPDREGY